MNLYLKFLRINRFLHFKYSEPAKQFLVVCWGEGGDPFFLLLR